MTKQEDALFASFLMKRKALNENLDQARRDIDLWVDRQALPPTLRSLADLEVMLKARRDLLQELAALDDDFMVQLLQRRGTEHSAPSQ